MNEMGPQNHTAPKVNSGKLYQHFRINSYIFASQETFSQPSVPQVKMHICVYVHMHEFLNLYT